MEPKELILQLLNNAKGDDIYRAKAAFRNYTKEQMQQKYGQSDNTPEEILVGYKKREDDINAAIKWVKSK